MRNRGWQSHKGRDASRELSVVVVEEAGELIGLVVDPARPVVRIRLGTLQPPAVGAACDGR